ncbi:hypothetical protein NUW54_g8143 [Trametes sanguinea]|uniref:Uncharacterized protein n=1 Tax=Trametes sanguinea TaxID=158606 RepID=A0ACC1PGG2_9APHY|nr:hypothetical protein NUW54_g8143 [Trametes sanguinea]
MSPKVTKKKGGPRPGQLCSKPKPQKLLVALRAKGFGCLAPVKSDPGTLEDVYNRNPADRHDELVKPRSVRRGKKPCQCKQTSGSLPTTHHPRTSAVKEDSPLASTIVTDGHTLSSAPSPVPQTWIPTALPTRGSFRPQPYHGAVLKSEPVDALDRVAHLPGLITSPQDSSCKTSLPGSASAPTEGSATNHSNLRQAIGVIRRGRRQYRASPIPLDRIRPPKSDPVEQSIVSIGEPARPHEPYVHALSHPGGTILDEQLARYPEAASYYALSPIPLSTISHDVDDSGLWGDLLRAPRRPHRDTADDILSFDGIPAATDPVYTAHARVDGQSNLSTFSTLARALDNHADSRIAWH